jgi:hypothetical protein
MLNAAAKPEKISRWLAFEAKADPKNRRRQNTSLLALEFSKA